ncbi:unnamed protein product, partial [Pleuronectes platessa]
AGSAVALRMRDSFAVWKTRSVGLLSALTAGLLRKAGRLTACECVGTALAGKLGSRAVSPRSRVDGFESWNCSFQMQRSGS